MFLRHLLLFLLGFFFCVLFLFHIVDKFNPVNHADTGEILLDKLLLTPKLRLAVLDLPQNLPLLFAAEHALNKIANQIEPWADLVREMIFTARKNVDEVLAREADACFNNDEWLEIMENDGVRFEDGERVEWVMAAILRGVKEPFAPSLYQV